jgi:hypothetical protein
MSGEGIWPEQGRTSAHLRVIIDEKKALIVDPAYPSSRDPRDRQAELEVRIQIECAALPWHRRLTAMMIS